MAESVINSLEEWWHKNGQPDITQSKIRYRYDGKPFGNIPTKEFNCLIEGFIYSEKSATTSIIQLDDIHIPFQDKLTLNVLYKFLADFKPSQIVIAGDMLDFYELSSFDGRRCSYFP